MPLLDPAPVFSPPWDVECVRGQGPVQLGDLLSVNWVEDDGTQGFGSFAEYAQHHHDVEMLFRPVFNYSIAGDRFVGFGIELNRANGELTANAWPATSHAPANFIVEAIVAR